MTPPEADITVRELTMAYRSSVIQSDLTFIVQRGDIFIIMGGSGKSTLLWHLIGLLPLARGEVLIDGENLWAAAPEDQERIKRRFGELFQNGGLWSSMTLAENVALPLETYTDLSPSQTGEVVSLKLALVGLAGFEEFYPSEINGGMQKRAGLALGVEFRSAPLMGLGRFGPPFLRDARVYQSNTTVNTAPASTVMTHSSSANRLALDPVPAQPDQLLDDDTLVDARR